MLLASTRLPAGGIPEASWDTLKLQRLEQPAPDFSPADGTRLSDLKGQWLVLHFWATWCGPCATELPALNRLYARRPGEGIAFLAIAIDSENADKIAEFVSRHGLALPIRLERDAQAGDRYWGFGLPVTYLIDPDGRIAARALGARDWDSAAGDALLAALAAH